MQKTICLIGLVFLMAGCVPMSQYRKLQKEKDVYTNQVGIYEKSIQKLKKEIQEKDERLRRFNQLSPDGRLR